MKQTVKKGRHYTLNRMFPFGKISRIISIDESCWHENSKGWSKLIGLTSIFIHKESIRLAFRPAKTKGKFKLAMYQYHKGERKILELYEVNAGENITVYINGYYWVINGIKYDYKARGCFIRANFYIGGNYKADKDCFILNNKN